MGPVKFGHGADFVELIAGLHGQQVLHGQIPHETLGHGADVVREQIHQLIRGRQQTVVHQKAHSQRRDAFAGGEGHAGQIGVLGAEGGLTQKLPVAQDQQAVHAQGGVLVQGLQKRGNLPGGDALLLGSCPGQGLRGTAQGDLRLLHAEILHGLRGSFGIQQPHQQLHGAVGRGQGHRRLLSFVTDGKPIALSALWSAV